MMNCTVIIQIIILFCCLSALEKKYADVFFLVDSKIPHGPIAKFKDELTKLIKEINVGISTHRFGLAQYAEDVQVHFKLNTHKTKQETLKGVQAFRSYMKPNQPHNLGHAMNYTKVNLLTHEAGGRAHLGYKQYLIAVSGNESDDPVGMVAKLLMADGVDVGSLSFGNVLINLQDTLPTKLVFEFPKLGPLKNLLLAGEREGIAEDCKGANVADVVFIVDESGSIEKTNFQLVRDFLHSMVGSLDVGLNRVRVGLVTYQDSTTAHIYLDTPRGKAEILQYISILPYSGGGTQTGAALNFTREQIFIETRGKRKGVQQVAVVITDGESQDRVSEAALNLRRDGVTIYCIGIRGAKISELEEMASHPSHGHIFNVESFTKLMPLKRELQKILCTNIIHEVVKEETVIKKACGQKDDADIFFLMDDSGSIGHEDFNDMKKFIIQLLKTFRIGKNHVRIGLVKYSDSPTLEFEPTTYSDVRALEKAVNGISHKGGGTKTGGALNDMIGHFDKAEASRGYKVPKYLIVITDGKSQDEVKDPADKIRAKDVIIHAIGVKDSNKKELEEIAGDPSRSHFVHNFDALPSLSIDITSDICSSDACKYVPLDIIFLVDSSGSISKKSYKTMKDFIKSLVSKSAIGKNDMHIAVMQFSSEPKMEFSLDTYYSQDEILKAIDAMQQMDQNTYTGKAIKEVSQYFSQSRGGRPGIGQRLLIITDGKAQDDVKVPAAELRAKNVVIYAIGVDRAETSQLKDLSGSQERVFYEKDFDELKQLENQLVVKLCEQDCKKTERADIIFLVDGSTSISQTDFGSMQIFMKSFVEKATVGKDQTRFGVILYATTPASYFVLKDFESKRDVLTAISNITAPAGDTYTSAALKFSSQYFGAVHGGRKALKVPQILMVITDGEATDPHDLKPASDKLREDGVTVFSIGVKGAKMEELKTMAGGDTSKVFYVDDFCGLIPVFCFSLAACEKEKADVIFLLDQSGSISVESYTLMINFTAQLVKSLDVREYSIRVGVAQFSDDPKHEFYLDKYSSKEDVIRHLQSIKQTGGNTYIGKALGYIKKYFEVSHGSRRNDWVPQNLVLITDGDSHDDVEDAAVELRSLGIVVFAIGVGDVHMLELLQITGTPEKLFTTRNFEGLETIKEKVVDAICKTMFPFAAGCTIDVAMGFDISRRPRAPGEMPISGHTKLQTFLPEIARYLSSVQGLCCVHPKDVETRMSYHVFNRNGQSLYDTNFEDYSEDAVKKVMTHLLSEPTYFNTALLNAFKEMFLTKSGANVKVLVIFSDGLDEDVMKLEQESELLRQSGKNALLTVALEKARDPAQLQMVEFGRGFNYHLPLSIGMPNVASTIFKQIVNRECCGITCKCSGHEGVRGSPGTPGSKVTEIQTSIHFVHDVLSVSTLTWGISFTPPTYLSTSSDSETLAVQGSRGQKGQSGFPGEEGVSVSQSTHLRSQRGETGRRVSGSANICCFKGQPGDPGIKGSPGSPGPRGAPVGNRNCKARLRPDVEACGPEISFCAVVLLSSPGRSECPAFPTELVFGLDMSKDVTPAIFQRQRDALLSLLEDVTVSESNCPTGARVAVVGYSSHSRHLIRFHDYHSKKQLTEAVKNIALERSDNLRYLGAAMHFVAHSTFKRVRGGLTTRKVAVFFSGGQSQDVDDVVPVMMGYRAFKIFPVVLSLRNAPAISRAMEVGLFQQSVLSDLICINAAAKPVQNCAICYDPCKRSEECAFIQEQLQPQEVDVDLVMVVDSSREMQADEYAGAQQLLSSVVEQLAVTSQPRRGSNRARVAVVQQSGTGTPKVEFSLQTYQDQDRMREHLIQTMQQQGGSSALGQTLEFTLREVLLKATQPRRKKALLVLVGTETAYSDRTKLQYISQKAKCEGVALFVVTVGDRYSRAQVEELASLPVQQHLIHVDRLKADDSLSLPVVVSEGVNTYPPPSLKQTCSRLIGQQDTLLYING
uniref:VWFA domain-containing protein n=1 Tax=Echeneis naucrates TaxID=173247 RepID=A0A665U1Y2_ECHNA